MHRPLEPRLRSCAFASATGLVGVVWLIAGLLCLSGCSPRRDHSLDELRREGVIRIGYAVEAPFAYVEDGRVTGEAPEIATLACRSLGLGRIEWVQMSFDELLPALKQRRCDVIAAGMFITAERRRRASFSIPTFQTRPALLVARGNPHGLGPDTNLAQRKDLRIAVLSGSVEQHWFEQHGYQPPRLVVVPDAATGHSAVATGLADALALSSLTLRRMAQAYPDTETIVLQPTSGMPTGFGAFAFRRKDTSLREGWDGFLRAFIGSPQHRHLVARFGFGPGEIPAPSAENRGGATATP